MFRNSSRRRGELLAALTAGAVSLSATLAFAGVVPDGAALEEVWNGGEFTEGVAAGPDGRIYFSDIASSPKAEGTIYTFDPASGEASVFLPKSGKSNGLMFDRDGRLIACCGANNGLMALCAVQPDGTMKPLVERYLGHRFASPNDLVIHADGGVYFSDPRYIGDEPMEVEQMRVYLFHPAASALRAVTDESVIQKPNGLALSPDLKTLYVAETNNGSRGAVETSPNPKRGRMTLNAFPIRPDGSLGDKRVLVDFGDQTGIDGMTVDRAGRIYAAVRSERRHGIVVYSPQGREIDRVAAPALPTNCCFGRGAEASRLYVTAGGGLYRIRLNAEGFHPAVAKR